MKICKKTTLLQKHGGKEEGMKTTLHLFHVYATNAGQSSCPSFPPYFRSRVVCFHLDLVLILFIGSSLHLNSFYRKFLPLVFVVFLGGFVLLSLIVIRNVGRFLQHWLSCKLPRVISTQYCLPNLGIPMECIRIPYSGKLYFRLIHYEIAVAKISQT